MQTFLPYSSFARSAACLDRQRLGKQRVECLQILNTIHSTNPIRGWRNHPAVLMWHGHTNALVHYGLAICDEWIARGYRDRCRKQIAAHWNGLILTLPDWIGCTAFHESHQSNLVRKLPAHYRQFFPDVPADLPYIWPVCILRH